MKIIGVSDAQSNSIYLLEAFSLQNHVKLEKQSQRTESLEKESQICFILAMPLHHKKFQVCFLFFLFILNLSYKSYGIFEILGLTISSNFNFLPSEILSERPQPGSLCKHLRCQCRNVEIPLKLHVSHCLTLKYFILHVILEQLGKLIKQ